MLAERIAADPKLALSPLVLLTSMDRQSDSQSFAAMGFTAYLTKPIRSRDLRDCLQRVLSTDASAANPHEQRFNSQRGNHTISAAERYVGNVLLVDDNTINQQVGRRFLERMGLTVTVANDGAEAVNAYQANYFDMTNAFDMIFMDLQMPVMDGYEATRRIRDFEAWNPRKPIIALTANAMSGQMERCIASGMDGFLTKPIQIELLREVVDKHCPKAAAAVPELDGPNTATLLETPADTHATLNVQRLRQTADDDLGFMHELAQLYIDSSQPILGELRSAWAANDRDNLRRIAHKLKGASASIHAERLVEACKALENHHAELGMPAVAVQIDHLEHLLAELVNELNALVKDNQSAA